MAIKKVRIKPPGYTDIVHPETSADVVIESATKRFVSDTDKANWNAKETPAGARAKVDAHANLTNNPHSVTKSQVGLGSVSNYGLATQAEAEAGTSSAKYMTPLRTKQAINVLQAVKSVASKTGTVTLTKGDVGLSNVDNTSDMDKPISTAVQTALNGKVDNSRVLTDVPSNAKFTDTTYSEISTSEINAGTSSTLRTISGRRIKYILDKVQGWINALTKADIGLGNVDNVKQASKTEFDGHNNDATRHITSVERTKWNTVDDKVDKVTGKVLSTNDYTTAEKNKLEGIATGANKYIHPSTHPASMITGLPTSLPANGGNADTVDNKHVDDTKTDTTALWTAGKIIAYVGSAGYGDMLKSVYDTNNDGIVDVAETVIGFDEHLADYALFKNGAFELWASRSTNTYKTIFDSPTAGDITEEIRNTISNDLVASKVTEFDTPTVGQISETLYIVEDNVTVTKTTTFDPDGSISEVIT